MMRALAFSTLMALGASCTVTAYQPTGGSQQGQQAGAGGTTQTSPNPAPTPAPTPSPSPSPTPPSMPRDMATTSPSPTPPDMATTPSADCTRLSNCCAQLPDPNDQQMCMDAVAKLDDQVCTNILQQLQGAGYCQ